MEAGQYTWKEMIQHRYTNRLIHEPSPYLQQHAHNPVDWYPWGEEAFEQARSQDKPIFLSIGYATCHWCHVMEKESFDDVAIAALLNEHFINVKVDREEHPQVEPGFRAYGLCYLELNAAAGAGLGTDWPVAIDHGSITETSWVMAMQPSLVDLERLPQDADATGIVGVYGPNPRHRADAALGEAQIQACADLLAARVSALLDGGRLDTMADLRRFVDGYWPEPLELAGHSGSAGAAAIVVSNPAPVSRYLTAFDLAIDGQPLDPATLGLINSGGGEAGGLVAASTLGPETGLYIRRGQSAEVRLPIGVAAGPHRLEVELGLAGVTSRRIVAEVSFR